MDISGWTPIDFEQEWVDRTEEAIRNKWFLLSPSQSLTVDLGLPLNSIVKLLEVCSQVERVSIGFDDEECAVQVVSCIGGATLEDESGGVWLCGQLRELRLSFLWDKCDVESWKKRATRVVKSRMGNRIALRVYGTWKGEGTHVVLA